MNIRLSCAASRREKRLGFTINKEGRCVDSGLYRLVSDNFKVDMLEALYQGILRSKKYVSHEDLLVIEVQNSHLADWLKGNKDSKGYEEYLDRVFNVLETIDCRYNFVYVEKPSVMKQLSRMEFPKVSSVGIGFMDTLEG